MEGRYAQLLERLEATTVSLATLLARGPTDRAAQGAQLAGLGTELRTEMTAALAGKAGTADIDRLRQEIPAFVDQLRDEMQGFADRLHQKTQDFVAGALDAHEQSRRLGAAEAAEATRQAIGQLSGQIGGRLDDQISAIDERFLSAIDERFALGQKRETANLAQFDRNFALLREQSALLDQRVSLLHDDLAAQIAEDRLGAPLEAVRQGLQDAVAASGARSVDALGQLRGFLETGLQTALEAKLQAVETALHERMQQFLDLTAEVQRFRSDSLVRLGGVEQALDAIRDDRQDQAAFARLEEQADRIAGAVADGRAAIGETLSAMSERSRRHEDIAVLALKRGVIPFSDDLVAIRAISAYLVVPGNDPVTPSLFEAGELEPQTTRVLARACPPGGLFVDVGASYGLTVTPVAQTIREGRIIAFEPTPRTAECLRATVQINGLRDRVEVREMALSAQSGSAELSIGASSTWNSLYPLPSAKGAVPVTVSTLDEQLPPGSRIDVLKIDVEGAELDVLAGGRRVLEESPDAALVVEYGVTHLARTGVEPQAWFDAFRAAGWTEIFVIEENKPKPVRLSDDAFGHLSSVNILFLRPGSPAFARLELS